MKVGEAVGMNPDAAAEPGLESNHSEEYPLALEPWWKGEMS